MSLFAIVEGKRHQLLVLTECDGTPVRPATQADLVLAQNGDNESWTEEDGEGRYLGIYLTREEDAAEWTEGVTLIQVEKFALTSGRVG